MSRLVKITYIYKNDYWTQTTKWFREDLPQKKLPKACGVRKGIVWLDRKEDGCFERVREKDYDQPIVPDGVYNLELYGEEVTFYDHEKKRLDHIRRERKMMQNIQRARKSLNLCLLPE